MAGLASETNPLARYQEFGWRSTDAPCAATYLLPSVLGLLDRKSVV